MVSLVVVLKSEKCLLHGGSRVYAVHGPLTADCTL